MKLTKKDLRTPNLSLICSLDASEDSASFEVYLSSGEHLGNITLYSDGSIFPKIFQNFMFEAYDEVSTYVREHSLNPHMFFD